MERHSNKDTVQLPKLRRTVAGLAARAAVLVAGAAVVGFSGGVIGLVVGMSIGGNFTEFGFYFAGFGGYGYEAGGVLGALIGLPLGIVVGALATVFRPALVVAGAAVGGFLGVVITFVGGPIAGFVLGSGIGVWAVAYRLRKGR